MSIKDCFISRFPDGMIMEADFSQLEIVGLAILSGDEVLKDDIISGRDMHRWRAAELFDKAETDVTDKERTLAKQLSFILQYGGGAKGMSEKLGVNVVLAQEFIDNYYARYKTVALWQRDVKEEVEASRKPTGDHTAAGYPKGEGTYTSVTGRVYKFYEYDAPAWSKWSKEPRFSPTEMKNYPVQGFATADIMALYRAKVYRRLLNNDLMDKVKLINTVHDSVMFDVQDMEMVQYLKGILEEEAAKLNTAIAELWNIKTDIPFKIECKAGPTWAKMIKLETK